MWPNNLEAMFSVPLYDKHWASFLQTNSIFPSMHTPGHFFFHVNTFKRECSQTPKAPGLFPKLGFCCLEPIMLWEKGRKLIWKEEKNIVDMIWAAQKATD